MRRARPEDSPLLAYVPEERHAEWIHQQQERLDECRAYGDRLTQQIPFIAVGTIRAEGASHHKLIVALGPELQQDLERVFPGLSSSTDGLFAEALMAMALKVDVDALEELATAPVELLDCPGVAKLSGAAGLVGHLLRTTNTGELLTGDIHAALYGIVTGAIAIGVTDPDAVMRELGTYFVGIYYSYLGETDEGWEFTGYYPILNQYAVFTFPIVLSPATDRVLVLLGPIGRDEVLSRLDSRGDPPQHVAELMVDGPSLYENLEALIETYRQYDIFKQEAYMDMLDPLKGLERLDLKLGFSDGALILEVTSSREDRQWYEIGPMELEEESEVPDPPQ